MKILAGLFDRNPELRLVLGLSAEILSGLGELDRQQIAHWQQAGYLDIGLLPSGNLPLPLLSKFRTSLETHFEQEAFGAPKEILKPYEVPRLLLRTFDVWRIQFPSAPAAGYILPLGLSETSIFEYVSASEAAWLVQAATGTRIADENSGLLILNARALRPLDSSGSDLEQGIYVLDEHFVLTQEEAQRLLEETAKAETRRSARFKTVLPLYWETEKSKKEWEGRNNPRLEQSLFSHWGNERTARHFWGTTAQKRYWQLMAQAREDIALYQNSGKAKLAVLDKLWSDYFSLLCSTYSAGFSASWIERSESETLDRRFREQFALLYAGLLQTGQASLPPAAKMPLWSEETESGMGMETTAGEKKAQVLILHDLYDMPGSPSYLKEFHIEWDEKNMHFLIKTDAKAPENWEVEIYIDLNRRPYEGLEKSLDGTLKAPASDFREYSLQLTSSGELSLFRFQPGGSLRREKHQNITAGFNKSVLDFRIPKTWISGRDPFRWGWALCLRPPGEIDCLQTQPSTPNVLFFAHPQR